MKKALLLACAFISFATISNAQITKGSILLGAGLNFSKGNTKTEEAESKSTMLSVNPSVGLAITENWVIGIKTALGNHKWKSNASNNKSELNAFSGGLFVRRYSPIGQKFYLFGDASISYDHNRYKEVYNAENVLNTVTKGGSFSFSPGINYAVSNRFQLEASLNNLLYVSYSDKKSKYLNTNYNTEEKSFSIGTNFSSSTPLSVGFRFVLGK